MRTLMVFGMLLIVPLSSLTAGDGDWGTASPFTLGAGARSIAMGQAAAAVWGESYSLLWNPAGLYQIEKSEVSLFHTSLFEESTGYSSLMLSYPFTELGVVSFGALQLRVGGIEQRDAENRVIEGELKNTQTRYILSYARTIVGGFTGGLNLKLDRFTQGSYSANGFGLDVGLGIKSTVQSPLLDGIAVGCSFVNIIEPKINLVSEEAGDPMGIRVGFSLWRSISQKMNDRLLLAFDFDKNRYAETHLHAGGEYRVYELLSMRGGWDAGDPTFGFGLELYSFLFDYAYRSTELGANHLFSVTFRFGPSRSERLETRRRLRQEEIRRELETEMRRFEARFVETSLQNGEKCLNNGEFEVALDHFQRVLLWAPENEQAKRGVMLSRASLMVQEGDNLMRLEKYTDALFSYRRAYGLVQTTGLEGRIQLCEQRIEETTDRQETVNNIFARSLELYTESEWMEAEEGFKQVLELDPSHALASEYLKKASGRRREAYGKSLSKADRLITEKRYGLALDVLRTELTRFPDDEELERRVALATELQAQAEARKQEARNQEEQEVELSQAELEDLRRLYERGSEFFKRGEFENAIDDWEIVWSMHPRFEQVDMYLVRAYQYRGMEFYAQRRYKEAIAVWDRILRVDPDNEKAIRYINRTREELEKLEELTG